MKTFELTEVEMTKVRVKHKPKRPSPLFGVKTGCLGLSFFLYRSKRLVTGAERPVFSCKRLVTGSTPGYQKHGSRRIEWRDPKRFLLQYSTFNLSWIHRTIYLHISDMVLFVNVCLWCRRILWSKFNCSGSDRSAANFSFTVLSVVSGCSLCAYLL